jgi:hypothetical protein
MFAVHRYANGGVKPRRSVDAGFACALLLSLSFVAITGCAQPRRTFQPSVDPSTLNDTVFVHYLAQTPLVTVDEGERAVLLLVGSTDQWPTPDGRKTELLRRGAIKASWRLESDRVLDVGTLAHMLRVLCDVPPGVNDRLGEWTGLGDRRAALRTCNAAGLLPYSVPHAPVTGGDLVSALTRAGAYREGDRSAGP